LRGQEYDRLEECAFLRAVTAPGHNNTCRAVLEV
jgi:hypothetical protein